MTSNRHPPKPADRKGGSHFNTKTSGLVSLENLQKHLETFTQQIQLSRATESKEYPLWSTLLEATDRPLDPGSTDHYPAARTAIHKDKGYTVENIDPITHLAAALWEWEADLWKHLGVDSWVEHLATKFGEQTDPTHQEYEYIDNSKIPKGGAKSIDDIPKRYIYGTPAMFEEDLEDLAGANDPNTDMLPLAEKVAAFMERTGKKGREIARELRGNWSAGGDVWSLFRHKDKQHDQGSAPIRTLRYLLARALWEDVVKAPMKRRRKLMGPAFTKATSDLIIQVSEPGVVFTPYGEVLKPKDKSPRKIEGIVAQIEEVDVRSLKTDTVHFWLSILAEVTHIFDRYVATGTVSNKIVLPGGWREVIDMVNSSLDWNLSTSSATQRKIQQAIKAQALLEFKIGNWRGNLLAYNHNEKTNLLTLTLGDMLLPHFGGSFGKSNRLSYSQRDWVNLVPVTKPASLQPFRHADHGKALSFQHVLIAYARDKREDILDGKGMELNPAMLSGLAAQARFPTPDKALDAWSKDGDDSPALLEKVGRYRYMIADNERFGPARQMIEQAAKKTRDARIRQQRKRLRDKESKYPKPEGDAP